MKPNRAAFVDGEEVASQTLKAFAFAPADETRARIGITYVHPAAIGWVVRYDDVVIDAE